MQLTIYGAGYVGLVSGVCLAELGHSVLCIDVDPKKIEMLKQGHLPIYEPNLENLLLKNQSKGQIQFSTDFNAGVNFGVIQMIAVGTPPLANGAADLSFVENLALTIADNINDYKLIITKSTVPVGTTDRVKIIIKNILEKKGKSIDFDVASNPEFLREGCAVQDFMHPDRIIIGIENEASLDLLKSLYQPLTSRRYPLVEMKIRSAELTKYASNTFLATKISFINEISQLAELTGADIEEIRKGIIYDSRINENFLNPGCGFGGSCFPKDVAALNALAIENGFYANIIPAVMATNHSQQRLLFNKINHYFCKKLENKTFAIWGLSFKPNTDDVRSATSRVVMELLWNAGAKVQVYDPMAMKNIHDLYQEQINLQFCEKAEEALIGADALVIFTEWEEFYRPDFLKMKSLLKNPVIFDGRNIFDPNEMSSLGFTYFAVGRPPVTQIKEKELI